MPFNNPKIKTPLPVTVGTQALGAVLVGPIKVDSGLLQGMLQMKAGSGGTTTPTACKVQISLDDLGTTFGDLPTTVTITSATTANTVTHVAIPETVCNWMQVIAGGAYAAGTSTLQLLGIEK